MLTYWQDIERDKRRRQNPEAMEEDTVDEVSENEIKAAHFEESMKYNHKVLGVLLCTKYFSSLVVLALNSSLKVLAFFTPMLLFLALVVFVYYIVSHILPNLV